MTPERRYQAALRQADCYDDVSDAKEQLRQDELAEELAADSAWDDEELAADSAWDDCDDPGDRVPY